MALGTITSTFQILLLQGVNMKMLAITPPVINEGDTSPSLLDKYCIVPDVSCNVNEANVPEMTIPKLTAV